VQLDISGVKALALLSGWRNASSSKNRNEYLQQTSQLRFLLDSIPPCGDDGSGEEDQDDVLLGCQ
jgi:hypothetical protein